MGFREVATLDADKTVALGGSNRKTGKKNPVSAEGYFLGTRKVESKKSKNGYANLHFLQTSQGNLGVWGKTDMDRKLAAVTPGTMIRITQTGMQATPNGDMYKYKVEVDETNTIDVSGLANVSANTETEDVEASDDNDGAEYGDSEESDANDEDEQQDAALLAAERKAKVQALLSKGKKIS